MKFGTPRRILAAAGVLALALVGLVARENIAREQGTEVRLALAGYDPRSLLQGHYVQFQLQPELPNGQCPGGSRHVFTGKPEWLALRRAGDHHLFAGSALSRAEAARLGDVVVRGTALCATTSAGSINNGRVRTNDEDSVSLDLGVDRIHLEQAEAEAVEAELRRVRPEGGPPGYAVLSIGADGKARVKGLIVGKRRVDLGWW